MKKIFWILLAATLPLPAAITPAHAEMLAMVVYETKAEESIRKLRLEEMTRPREDGLAIIELDRDSEAYGKILMTFPLPKGAAPHH